MAKKKKKNLISKSQYLGKKKAEVKPIIEVKRSEVKFEKKKQEVDLEALMKAVLGNEKFLTLEQAAEHYGVTIRAVRKWAYRGHVPLLVLPSRFYIPLSDLKAYRGK